MTLLTPPEGVELHAIDSTNRAAKTFLIIGVFHGEEPQGQYVITKYLKENKPTNSKNKLYFMPCLNPWGMKRAIRTNKNGVDLNRNYPTNNWKQTPKDENYSGDFPASEIETQYMIKLLDELKPDAILSLHAPLECVNYDGPAKHLAAQIATICKYPIIEDLGYPTPGSFGTYCGIEKNIPIITLEYNDKESNDSIYSKSLLIFDLLRKLD